MYEYNWIYTIAQIELMNIDAPITCYKERKDSNRKPTRRELDNVVKKWQERKKKRKWKMRDLLIKGNKDNKNITDEKGKES